MPTLAVVLTALHMPEPFLPEHMEIPDDPEMKIMTQLGTLRSARRIMHDMTGIRDVRKMPEKMRLLYAGYLRAEYALGLKFKSLLPERRGYFSRICANPNSDDRRIFRLDFEQCSFEMMHRSLWSFDVGYQVHLQTYPRMFGEGLAKELVEMTRSHVYTTPALDSPGETLKLPEEANYGSPHDCRAWGGDTDGDAICDFWELFGVPDDAGNIVPIDEVFDYDGDGKAEDREIPDVFVKDVYVEIDWLRGFAPNELALAAVTLAFTQAPVENPDPANPRLKSGGPTGIRLHNGTDEEIRPLVYPLFVSFAPSIYTQGDPPSACTPDASHFDALKRCYFGTARNRSLPNAASIRQARAKVFRYALYVNDLSEKPESAVGGVAEIGGNDFMIAPSDAGWLRQLRFQIWYNTPVFDTGLCGLACQQLRASTYMHELGHSLGLRHGGGDDLACKPNYLGIMNYHEGYYGVLDYSRVALPDLDECKLDEPAGLRGGWSPDDPRWPAAKESLRGRTIGYGGANFSRLVTIPADSESIDWNGDGQITPGTVSADIDALKPEATHELNGLRTLCNGDGLRILEGHDDWNNLQYDFRQSRHFLEGTLWEDVPDLRPAKSCSK